MSRRGVWGAAALLLACCTAARADEPAVQAPDACASGGCASGACAAGGCATGACGSRFGCLHCPKTCFPREKPPCVKWRCVCPKPVCEPCSIEGYGFYATCWRPWAYPPNYEHCPVPPPGVLASQAPPLIGPGGASDEALPAPMKAANPNPNR